VNARLLLLHSTLLLLATTLTVHADSRSPYAGQERAAIKALSAQEHADLLEGKGMGLAKAAELNGYPGPMHVLALATELELTADQESRSRTLFTKMREAARAAGAKLIVEERELDRLYASRSATRRAVDSRLERIEAVRTRLRALHLQAHLDQAALLTQRQITRYAALRGYGVDQQEVHEVHEPR
jgi:Spy/CpxP family protein refolding chaperone